jgi:hypothetical protein
MRNILQKSAPSEPSKPPWQKNRQLRRQASPVIAAAGSGETAGVIAAKSADLQDQIPEQSLSHPKPSNRSKNIHNTFFKL